MTVPITVAIPVGPLHRHRWYLEECVFSLIAQTEQPSEILVIESIPDMYYPKSIRVILDTANNIADAFNHAIAKAANEHIFLLGSDDFVYPRCMELCWAAWLKYRDPLGWYYVAVHQSDGYEQNTPCMAAMVTKELFRVAGPLTADFAPHASCEIEFIDRLLRAGGQLGNTYKVSDEILYYWRSKR